MSVHKLSLSGKTFKYFAYGSNLLEQRIHINNPTAKRLTSAVLADYRLDFKFKSKRWGGHTATIVPHPGSCVWGAIWIIDQINQSDLDKQEGVPSGIYRVLEVEVKSIEGEIHNCRSYILTDLPENTNIAERPPSKVYLETILKGAKESRLPEEYIKKLEAIPHNGFDGPVNYTID